MTFDELHQDAPATSLDGTELSPTTPSRAAEAARPAPGGAGLPFHAPDEGWVPPLLLSSPSGSTGPRRTATALASLLALGAGFAVPAGAIAADPGASPAVDTTATQVTTPTDTTTTPTGTPTTSTGTTTTPTPATPTTTTPTTTGTTPGETTPAPSTTPAVTTTTTTTTSPTATTPTPGTPTGTTVTVTGTKTVPTPKGKSHRQRPGKSRAKTGARGGKRHDAHARAKRKAHHKAKHHRRKTAPGGTNTFTTLFGGGGGTWGGPVMVDPFTAAQLHHYAQLVAMLTLPPKYLVKIYKAAARHYRLPWQVLAGINYVETHYGQDLAVSSAGAEGWMQFMPSTWAQYGVSVDANGNVVGGGGDPWQARDAIFSAARYLDASGGAPNLTRAVYSYNHAGWYVQEVLSFAQEITEHGVHVNSKPKRKLYAMRTVARLLNGMPYVWGGGHATWLVSAGYDCSGFVSAVLHAGGYLKAPSTTQTIPGDPAIKAGPGRYVTIYDRTDRAITSDHVVIRLGDQWWESGGGGLSGAARVHRIWRMDPSYLQSFNLVLHPRGM